MPQHPPPALPALLLDDGPIRRSGRVMQGAARCQPNEWHWAVGLKPFLRPAP